MKYAFEMGLGAMIYVPCFRYSNINRRDTHRDTQTAR
jgi:hypothetical protein